MIHGVVLIPGYGITHLHVSRFAAELADHPGQHPAPHEEIQRHWLTTQPQGLLRKRRRVCWGRLTWWEVVFPLDMLKLLREVAQQPLLGGLLAHQRWHLFPQVPDDEHVDAERPDPLAELVHLRATGHCTGVST